MSGVTTADALAPERVHRPASLPLVALVLGIAGVALGVTVVWYFAAVPVGVVAAVVGLLALRRTDGYEDPRAGGRATIGAVLGLVAIVLGVSAAYLLPRAVDRVDHFFSSLQDDVNQNVNEVNVGLRDDVRSLDRTVTRDLRRLEDQNRRDLEDLERREGDALSQLESRLTAADGRTTEEARADLVRLEASLRQDLRGVEAALRSTDDLLAREIAVVEARVTAIEKKLGL